MEVERKMGLVLLPIENISPRYRDEAITRFNPVGVPMLFLSPILGGPECTAPVGQVAYESRVSNRREFLPVGISLLSAPGTDLELLDMVVSCLEHSGRPTTVLTGKTMFRH
jgi:Asp-tRNA(Asn)/Glu-tRNA(Gln) amidotransferase A subunit family amidase